MRRFRSVGIVLAFCAGVVVALAAQAVKDEVTRAEEAWAQARTAGDKEAYSNLLADDFTWTFTTGNVTDKQQTVDNLRAAPSPVTSKDIRIYQDAAVVVGTAKLTVGNRPVTEKFVRVWAKRRGIWRAVLFQATETPQ
jgi:uncharacterized protein DUF4440